MSVGPHGPHSWWSSGPPSRPTHLKHVHDGPYANVGPREALLLRCHDVAAGGYRGGERLGRKERDGGVRRARYRAYLKDGGQRDILKMAGARMPNRHSHLCRAPELSASLVGPQCWPHSPPRVVSPAKRGGAATGGNMTVTWEWMVLIQQVATPRAVEQMCGWMGGWD